MTPEELKDELTSIVQTINQAGGVASVFVPQYSAFIALGMAVDKLIPGIAEGIANWVQGNPPTEAELKDTAAKLAVLSDPDLP